MRFTGEFSLSLHSLFSIYFKQMVPEMSCIKAPFLKPFLKCNIHNVPMECCIRNSVFFAHLKILPHLHYVLYVTVQREALDDISVLVAGLLGGAHNTNVILSNTMIN